MESNQNTRQQKIARQIQRDMAEILQKEGAARRSERSGM